MTVSPGLTVAFALLAAYLVSAVPFGYLLFKLLKGGDIRTQGSGNIGATNVFRAGGKTVGVVTLALDIAKGAVSVALARSLGCGPGWEPAAAFAAVLGHCFPVYLRFKGGKGIATGCGAYGVLAPVPMAITLGVFLAALLITRTVSVGSICAGIVLPFLILWLKPESSLLISVGAAALLVIVRHQANIRRLLAGREGRFDDE